MGTVAGQGVQKRASQPVDLPPSRELTWPLQVSPNILFAPDVGVNGCALNGEHLEVGVMESAKKKYENVEDVIRYQLMNRRDALRTGLGAGAAVLFGGGLLGACSSGGGSYSG